MIICKRRHSSLLSATFKAIDQVQPFLAWGKSVVFQTKLGACQTLLGMFLDQGEVKSTYNSLDDISQVISSSDENSSLLTVVRANLVDVSENKRACTLADSAEPI